MQAEGAVVLSSRMIRDSSLGETMLQGLAPCTARHERLLLSSICVSRGYMWVQGSVLGVVTTLTEVNVKSFHVSFRAPELRAEEG